MAKNVTVEDNSAEVLQEMQKAVERAMIMIGIQAEGYAKGELSTPKAHSDGTIRPNVDTGRLRASVTFATKKKQGTAGPEAKQGDYATHAKVDGGTVVIGTNVEYAPYLEFGTSRAGKFPYLRPAIEKHIDEYKRIIKDELGD